MLRGLAAPSLSVSRKDAAALAVAPSPLLQLHSGRWVGWSSEVPSFLHLARRNFTKDKNYFNSMAAMPSCSRSVVLEAHRVCSLLLRAGSGTILRDKRNISSGVIMLIFKKHSER